MTIQHSREMLEAYNKLVAIDIQRHAGLHAQRQGRPAKRPAPCEGCGASEARAGICVYCLRPTHTLS